MPFGFEPLFEPCCDFEDGGGGGGGGGGNLEGALFSVCFPVEANNEEEEDDVDVDVGGDGGGGNFTFFFGGSAILAV